MVQTRANEASQRRDSALGLTRFPSLAKWEDPWEGHLDLVRLRAKAPHFEVIQGLAADPRHEGHAKQIDRQQILKLVDHLELDAVKAKRLVDDTVLIATWYWLPEWQSRAGMGLDRFQEDLDKTAKWARRFSNSLAPIAAEAEHLFQALPTGLGIRDDANLIALSHSAGLFAFDARKALEYLRPTGRRRDARRNVAIALATWAVEEAAGEQVSVSRGRSDRFDPHFTNPPGRFVRGLLSLLGHRDEQILVSAFEKLRRKPRVTKPR